MGEILHIAQLYAHRHHAPLVHTVEVMTNRILGMELLCEILVMAVQAILPRIMHLWELLLPAAIPQRNPKAIPPPLMATVRPALSRLPTAVPIPPALARNGSFFLRHSRGSPQG